MKPAFAVIAISAVALLSVGHAFAAPLTLTYKGTVSSGVDNDGLFGQAGANLGGKSFEVVQTFDTSKASGAYSSWGYNISYGGAGYGTADFSTSKIKIGSSAFHSIKSDYGSLVSKDGYTQNFIESYSANSGINIFDIRYAYTSFYAYAPTLTGDLQPTTILFDGTTSFGGGTFTDASYRYDYNAFTFQSTTHAYAGLNLQSLTVGAVSAVPLPGSAPMFGAALLGLGAVGFCLKRRRTVAIA